MDRMYAGEGGGVSIGRGNVFFEYATVHRAVGEGAVTRIGDENFVMAYVHIAHNCSVGDGCVLTNGVQLAGHAEVGDRANIGGLTGVHQHCRIGELAMVGACSYVNRDIPPFLLACGNPCRVRGVNVVGLRRAGQDRLIGPLKKAFRIVYRSNLNLGQAVNEIEERVVPECGHARAALLRLVAFLRSGTRGIELRTGKEEEQED